MEGKIETKNSKPHEKIFEILFDKDEITWQSIIYDLVKTEQMNPWDVDISLLTQKYIEMVKKLKELDFRVSGKVLLAAAILLKIKSNRLVGEDIDQLDRLFSQTEETEEGLYEEMETEHKEELGRVQLIPRIPQPRKRKVSIYDLVGALEKALEVKRRRVMYNIPPTNINIPIKTKDITEIIRDVYGKIKSFFFKNSKNKLTFSQLIPSNSRTDKVYTFIPLLHLSNQRKIEMEQYKHFGEIEIMLKTEREIDKEIIVSGSG